MPGHPADVPRILRIIAITALIVLAGVTVAQGAPAGAAKDPAAAPIATATALSQTWGRCPSARTAHHVLAVARRTRAVKPRVKRARAAVRAWRGVVRECSKPIEQPIVIVGGTAYLPAER